MPFLSPFLVGGFGSPKIDYSKKGTLLPTSLLEDLGHLPAKPSFS